MTKAILCITVAMLLANRGLAQPFTAVAVTLPDTCCGTVAWGDYDNDGDLDLLVSGSSLDANNVTTRATRLYRNDEATFVDVETNLLAVSFGSAEWGDYDSDGNLDVVVTGIADSLGGVSRLYRNDGGTFTTVQADLPGIAAGQAVWGDYDNDGDLDVLVSGEGSVEDSPETITRLFRNDRSAPNHSPSSPTNLHVTSLAPRNATLCWDGATDDTTPQRALTYNLRVGTSPARSDVMAPMAVIGGEQDGRRLLVGYGNAGQQTCFSLANLAPGTMYYAAVQALDHGFAGSAFSTEIAFSTATDVANEKRTALPDRLTLWPNHPNPFTRGTTIRYALPRAGHVQLTVYDMLGRRVVRLVDERQSMGIHSALFEAQRLPSGVYLCSLTARDEAGRSSALHQTMLLVK